MKPEVTKTICIPEGRLNVLTALGHMLMASAQRWVDNQCRSLAFLFWLNFPIKSKNPKWPPNWKYFSSHFSVSEHFFLHYTLT